MFEPWLQSFDPDPDELLDRLLPLIDDEMLLSLRRLGSPIHGHPAPVPELPWVEAATGSLGQGPAIGLGMARGSRFASTGSQSRSRSTCGA